jgi:hypothetical protein
VREFNRARATQYHASGVAYDWMEAQYSGLLAFLVQEGQRVGNDRIRVARHLLRLLEEILTIQEPSDEADGACGGPEDRSK